MKTFSRLIRIIPALGLVLAAQAGLTQDSPQAAEIPSRSWASAPRHSAGIAPDPVQLAHIAIVQVYVAPTYGWRAPHVVQRNYAVPDGLWYGAIPELLVDQRGEGVDAMIDAIEAAVASYPFADQYRTYPGPNSNTFLAHVGRQVPALQLDLPANAIGKDYRPLTNPVGVSPSGSGLQISLLGLLGVSVGAQEGLEFNVLGLNFGLDLNTPALRLPFWGRWGMKEVPTSYSAANPGHALVRQ